MTLFLVFSDKMAENGDVNSGHMGKKNGKKKGSSTKFLYTKDDIMIG